MSLTPPSAPYTIAVLTKGNAGQVVCTQVTIGHVIVDETDVMRVDLCDHPLFAELQEYVLNNPVPRLRGPSSPKG